MNLTHFRANGAFRQSSSSIFGNPESAGGGNLGTAMLFEPRALEREGRVQQPPKILETFAGPKGKSDLSEQLDRDIMNIIPRQT